MGGGGGSGRGTWIASGAGHTTASCTARCSGCVPKLTDIFDGCRPPIPLTPTPLAPGKRSRIPYASANPKPIPPGRRIIVFVPRRGSIRAEPSSRHALKRLFAKLTVAEDAVAIAPGTLNTSPPFLMFSDDKGASESSLMSRVMQVLSSARRPRRKDGEPTLSDGDPEPSRRMRSGSALERRSAGPPLATPTPPVHDSPGRDSRGVSSEQKESCH